MWAVGCPGTEFAYFENPIEGAKRLRDAEGEEPPPDLFRLEVHFADGKMATTLDLHRNVRPRPDEPPGPILLPGSGMAGATRSEQEYWVWPLPPEGPLTFVCAWPANGIDRSEAQIDAGLILHAAARATHISPQPRD